MLQLTHLKTARRVCAVLGPLLLLLAWVTQQFWFDRWNGQLNRLNSAEAAWDVYRSNHYVFNAVRPPAPEDDYPDANEPALKWQLRNLDVGSQRIEGAMRPATVAAAAGEVREANDGGFGGPDGAMDLQFKTLKLALERERAFLTDRKRSAQYLFWFVYALGAALTLCATVLKERIEAKEGK